MGAVIHVNYATCSGVSVSTLNKVFGQAAITFTSAYECDSFCWRRFWLDGYKSPKC